MEIELPLALARCRATLIPPTQITLRSVQGIILSSFTSSLMSFDAPATTSNPLASASFTGPLTVFNASPRVISTAISGHPRALRGGNRICSRKHATPVARPSCTASQISIENNPRSWLQFWPRLRLMMRALGPLISGSARAIAPAIVKESSPARMRYGRATGNATPPTPWESFQVDNATLATCAPCQVGEPPGAGPAASALRVVQLQEVEVKPTLHWGMSAMNAAGSAP